MVAEDGRIHVDESICRLDWYLQYCTPERAEVVLDKWLDKTNQARTLAAEALDQIVRTYFTIAPIDEGLIQSYRLSCTAFVTQAMESSFLHAE